MVRYLFVSCCLILSACQYGVRSVDSAADILPGDLILVGKVILDPPLAAGEQELGAMEKSQANLINIFTSQEQVMIDPSNIRYGDMRTVVKAPIGGEFFAIAPYREANITGAMIYLNMNDSIYFPGGWRYVASEQDQAIYIGTIKYRRNEFYEIVGVKVIDEYAQANREFAGKFGSGIKLRKALLHDAGQ